MAKQALTALLSLLPALTAAAPAFGNMRGGNAAASRPVEVRVVSPSQSLLVSPSLTLSPASVLSAPSLAPAPALSVAPAVRPAAALAAPAESPKLPLAATPAGERTQEVLAALSPDAVSRAPAESSREKAAELFAEAGGVHGGFGDVAGLFSAPAALAHASLTLPAAADGPAAPAAAPRPKASLRDHLHHWRLLRQSFWWYMTTNVRNKWRSQRAAWSKARAEGPVAVSRQREFFAAMRTTGMSGHFYVLGGAAVEDAEVMTDMRAAFTRYFDHPAIGYATRDSFEHFMARAMVYNTAHRSHTYFYKTIRDAMIKASVMRPDQLGGYFDGLLQEGTAQETLDFQNKGEQKRVADQFRAALLSVLDQEDPRAPDRVVAALVLGSFASGAAGPRSDFDVEVLTANGSDKRVVVFAERLQAAWKATGLDKNHPASAHDHAARPTRAYLDLVHSAPYFIVARSAAVEAELSRAPGEGPRFTVDRRRDTRGRLGVLLQGLVVRGTIWVEELKHFLRKLT